MTNRRALALILVIPFGPPIVVWTFASTLVKGIGSAFADAWNQAAIEIISIRRSLSDGI